ncbi:Variant-specific surface protein [Giardia duodenalis]|uniref:Variant-specific surface protein n=1 Tax=Giardia intestinalis TaxID=5741 RepID=V6TP87_GIAIN|nr:Variant-specific surface protein [Giardia intestinalis]
MLAIYLAVGALAVACTESGTAKNNCAQGKCEMVGTTEICAECTDTYVPINGQCQKASTVTDKCTTADGDGSQASSQTCGKCKGQTFMYKGGCYDIGQVPGSLICETAGSTEGVCQDCQAGYFKNPEAAATVDSCISCGDTTGVTVGNGDSAKTYTGVAGCAKCTAPTAISETTGTKAAVCTECAAGFLHTPTGGATSCVETCPKGYFGHTDNSKKKTCQSCSSPTSSLTPPVTGIPGCASCTYTGGDSGTLTCSECNEGKKPSLDGLHCYACAVDNCASCDENSVCQKCISGFVLDGAACTQQTCSTPDCKTCTNPKTATEVCTMCAENKYLTPTSQCVDACSKLGNYYGAADGKCKECTVDNCAECNTDGSCKTCNTGFFPDANECKACDSSCKSCSGATAEDCTECPSGKALKYGNDDTKGTCGEGCVVNTDQASGNCKTCDLTVEGTKYCSACATDSEYPQNGVCSSTTSRAATCNDVSISGGVCTACASNYFRMNGGCYETTRYPGKSVCTQVASGGNTCASPAPGYKVDNGNLVTCPEGCKACSDATACTTCADGYVLANNACSKCDASCLTCETDASTCKACASGYYLSGSTCTSCESNNGGITGVKGCASCAAPAGNTGSVLCYLVGMALLAPSPHVPVGTPALLLVSQVSPAPCRACRMVAEYPSGQ